MILCYHEDFLCSKYWRTLWWC